MYHIYCNNYLVESVDTKEEAQSIVNSEPYGYFTWKHVCNPEELRYVSPEVGYVDQDEEYY